MKNRVAGRILRRRQGLGPSSSSPHHPASLLHIPRWAHALGMLYRRRRACLPRRCFGLTGRSLGDSGWLQPTNVRWPYKALQTRLVIGGVLSLTHTKISIIFKKFPRPYKKMALCMGDLPKLVNGPVAGRKGGVSSLHNISRGEVRAQSWSGGRGGPRHPEKVSGTQTLI